MFTNPYGMQGQYYGGMTAGAAASPYSYGGYGGYGAGSGGYPMPYGQTETVMGAGMMPPAVPNGSFVTPTGGSIVTIPAAEESYVENILRLNRGKMATVYMTYENNSEWNAKIYKGIVEAAGRDHLILSDPSTGLRYLLLMVNLDYITFNEPINYEYPFAGGVVTNATPFQTEGR